MLTNNKLLIAFLGLTACSGDLPDQVFVPGPSFSEALAVRTEQGDSARVTVGSPLVLYGLRFRGPWIQVARNSLPEEACWTLSPPDSLGEEIAGSVRWTAHPPEAQFNTQLRLDQTREVRFRRPGLYLLTAHSSRWCSDSYIGDTVWVEVTAQ